MIIIATLSLHQISVDATSDINVVIEQYRLVNFPDQRPIIDENSRTLIPVRFISQELGANVGWVNHTQEVTIAFEGDLITIPIGSKIATIDNGLIKRQVDMGTSAILVNGRSMVPLRFVSEALGSLVFWEGSSRTVFIERMVRNRPDKSLIEKINNIDENTFNLISKREGYTEIMSWTNLNSSRTSQGQFVDYSTPISLIQNLDSIYLEFDSVNSNNVSWISVYFSTDSEHNNFFYYDITPEVTINNNHVIIRKDQFSIGQGNPSWNNIRYFRIAFQAKQGTTFSFESKKLSTFNSISPMITLWFDDGWEDNFTNAFQITTRIDPTIRGAVGIVGSLVGTDRYLSKDQIRRLRAGGWEIVNHSYSHPDLTTLTDEEIKREIELNFNIVSDFDAFGGYHFVVPYSSVNDRVLKIIKETSLSARHVPQASDRFPFDRYNLGFFEVTNETSFQDVREYIDNAIQNNLWIGLLFHRIEDPSDDRYSYGTQEFEQLIYYLRYRKNDIRIVTPSEAFNLAGIPIN
jgi:peptidoglycan/xylan/chitin deacetylase (PgdA/CDA1 family)